MSYIEELQDIVILEYIPHATRCLVGEYMENNPPVAMHEIGALAFLILKEMEVERPEPRRGIVNPEKRFYPPTQLQKWNRYRAAGKNEEARKLFWRGVKLVNRWQQFLNAEQMTLIHHGDEQHLDEWGCIRA